MYLKFFELLVFRHLSSKCNFQCLITRMIGIILILSFLGPVFSSGFRNRGFLKDYPLTLYWEFLDDDLISVEIEWNKFSFIPVLLNRSMVGTDLWLCSAESGQQYALSDRWAFDHAPPQLDIDPAHGQGSNDFINPRVKMTSTGIICKFTRKLNTGDFKDKILVKGQTYHLCSIDTETPYLKKHNNDLSNIFCYYWHLIDHFDGELTSSEESNSLLTVHGVIMTVMWGILVDVALITVRYFKTTKTYTKIHSFLLLIINSSIITMALVMIAIRSSIIFYNFDILSPGAKFHFILGLTFISCLVLQQIGGAVMKYLKQRPEIKAQKFLSKINYHRVGGYVLYFIGKVQLTIGWWIYTGKFSILVAMLLSWYAILAVIRIALEYGYRTKREFFQRLIRPAPSKSLSSKRELLLSSTNLDYDQLIGLLRQGKSKEFIRHNFPNFRYVHFKNYVCDVSDFNHPGGASLLEDVLGDDVSKYLYGAAWIEDNPTKKYIHSIYALSYLQSKKFYENEDSTCQIFGQNWQLRYITEISPNLFKINFKNSDFTIKTNPENYDYLGKSFLVTCSQTRPYTLLLSQLDCNVAYRNKILQFYKRKFTGTVDVERKQSSTEISFFIKRYDLGVVSKQVHFGVKSIEGLYGIGLQIESGTNIIVTGGTGILPFLDLFDLLLRKAIFTAAESHEGALDHINTYRTNYRKAFPNCKFKLYASFASTQQFKCYNWLLDLHLISKKLNLDIFQLNLKIPKQSELMEANRNFVTNINEEFCSQHFKLGSFTKIYCCGPPEMTTEIVRILKKLRYPADCYRIM